MKTVQFLAVLLTALALVPAGAHLAVLPNKLDLAQDTYFALCHHARSDHEFVNDRVNEAASASAFVLWAANRLIERPEPVVYRSPE